MARALIDRTFSLYGCMVRLGLALAMGLFSAVYTALVPPHPFAFFERDPRMSQVVVDPAHVPDWALFVIAFGIPLIAIGVLHASCSKLRRPWWHTISFFGMCMGWTAIILALTKIHLGRPRPNFFALCDYKGYADATRTGNYTAYWAATTPGAPGSYSDCAASDYNIRRAHRSFPSGHAGLSFAGLGFLAMLLYSAVHELADGQSLVPPASPGEFAVPPQRTPVSRCSIYALRYALPIACVVGAFLVAESRIYDYWHNFDDVSTGAIIGAVVAAASFRSYLRGEVRDTVARARSTFDTAAIRSSDSDRSASRSRTNPVHMADSSV